MLLQRNLVYTGISRGKKLAVLIGHGKALTVEVWINRTENEFFRSVGTTLDCHGALNLDFRECHSFDASAGSWQRQ